MLVIPLVEVAWADGQIQDQERETVLEAARQSGVQPKDGKYPLLEHWLKRKPGPQMLEAWKQYIAELCRRLQPEEIAGLKRNVLGLASRWPSPPAACWDSATRSRAGTHRARRSGPRVPLTNAGAHRGRESFSNIRLTNREACRPGGIRASAFQS